MDNIVLWKCGKMHESVEICLFFWYLSCLYQDSIFGEIST